MSDAELTKFEILRDVDHELIAVSAAARLLHVSERHVWRMLHAYRADGVDGIVSKKRGRPSNRKIPDDVRAVVMAIVKDRYPDFGPTFAAEKLRELHNVLVSRETLRAWMIAEGLWRDRKKRQGRVYQPRYRRDCIGELVQLDGSEHRWFEDRGPMCTLLVYIDDATSRLMHLQFVETESTFAYFKATQSYLEAHGKPLAFYTDKHSVFRVNKAGSVLTDGITQFGRALQSLSIEIICANSSQAKGRVERANKTLQDRLVKELRLAGINTLDEGNAFLPAFVMDYNARFAKAPANTKDLHRPLGPRDDLEEAFAWRVERTLSKALTLQYDNVLFILDPTPEAQAAIGQRVTVVDYPQGRIAVRHKGGELPYRTFQKTREVKQAAIADNKRLGALLAMIRQTQVDEPKPVSRRGPRRRDQGAQLFDAN